MGSIIRYLHCRIFLEGIESTKLVYSISETTVDDEVLFRGPTRLGIFSTLEGESPDLSGRKLEQVELRFSASI